VRRTKHDRPANPDPETTDAFGECLRCCMNLSDEEKEEWYRRKQEEGDRCSWLDKCVRACLATFYATGELPDWCLPEKELIVRPKEVTVDADEVVNYSVENCQGDITVDYGYGEVFDITPCVDGVASFKIKNWGIVGTHEGTVTDGKSSDDFHVTVRGVPECAGYWYWFCDIYGGAPEWWKGINKRSGVVVNNGRNTCVNNKGRRILVHLPAQTWSSFSETISVDECWQYLDPGQCFSPQRYHVTIHYWSAGRSWRDCGGASIVQYNAAQFKVFWCVE